jgi:hypothetical protein
LKRPLPVEGKRGLFNGGFLFQGSFAWKKICNGRIWVGDDRSGVGREKGFWGV